MMMKNEDEIDRDEGIKVETIENYRWPTIEELIQSHVDQTKPNSAVETGDYQVQLPIFMWQVLEHMVKAHNENNENKIKIDDVISTILFNWVIRQHYQAKAHEEKLRLMQEVLGKKEGDGSPNPNLN